jgi:hypothetical protein
MRSALLLLSTCLVFFSCRRGDDVDPNAFFNCHNTQNLDSAAIVTKLVGTWRLSSRFCISGHVPFPPPSGVSVNFDAGGGFKVFEFHAVVMQGAWKLKPALTSGLWQLDLSTPSNYLLGNILFCGNEVKFNNLVIAGCDNTFYR